MVRLKERWDFLMRFYPMGKAQAAGRRLGSWGGMPDERRRGRLHRIDI